MINRLQISSSLGDKCKLLFLNVLQTSLAQRILHRLGSLPDWLNEMRVRVRALGDCTVSLNPTDPSQVIVFDEVLVHQTYDLSKVPFEPDLILDCGGHIGLFSLLARHHFPKVTLLTFEPSPRNRARLESQFTRNRIEIEVIPAAVAEKAGTLLFREPCSCAGHLIDAQMKQEGDYEVPVIDLPDLILAKAPKRLLIKMDIEGGERTLIPALIPILPQQTAFFFETHDGEQGWLLQKNGLESAGFKVGQLNMRDLYADGYALRV